MIIKDMITWGAKLFHSSLSYLRLNLGNFYN